MDRSKSVELSPSCKKHWRAWSGSVYIAKPAARLAALLLTFLA